MITHHATAKRAVKEHVLKDYGNLGELPYLGKLIEALPYVAAILNEERQIVFTNSSLLKFLDIADIGELLEKRPGEALRCIHSKQMDAGCGTTKFCQVCGMVNTIMRCQETGNPASDECRIRTFHKGSEDWLDLEITASPFTWNKRRYIIITARDISIEKRKEALERIFFHDVINTAGTLQGLVDVLKQLEDPKKISQFINLLAEVSKDLTEEILNQKSLLAAENGELAVKNHSFYLLETLAAIVKEFREHELALNKKINLTEGPGEVTVYSDPVLIKRVVTNMIKNALEATNQEDDITIDCQIDNEYVLIGVHNPAFMPESVQKQVFQRSFSTKGKGRGLGTYSMKLLSEKYLGGKVYFTSSRKEGTWFYLRLPKESGAHSG
jgi:K+-sensing histidine kinase KdpD